MTRAILIVAALVALIAAGQTWRANRLSDRLDRAEAALSGYREAAEIRAREDRRLTELATEAATLDRDLATQEGADAPLGDYLSAAARRLWPD